MIKVLAVAAGLLTPVQFTPDVALGYDVVILGERHDNVAHHAFQTEVLRAVQPTVVVYEMLSPSEADALASIPRDPAAMLAATDGFTWGNIADYAALLAASPVIVGAAVDRDTVRAAFDQGAAGVFTGDAQAYGLADPLPEAEQSARETLQLQAHCDAMPASLMGGMVQAQRLRDAAFAHAVVEAFAEHGAPVVLITGNGHARIDWGVPSYLARVAPDLSVLSVGQTEDGVQAEGSFGVTVDSPRQQRGDPCAAFR